MTLTLLLDLDDTLLTNSMDGFLPSYLKALGKHLSSYVPAERMIPQLLAATQAMVAKQVPGDTLEAVFDAGFYPALGLQKATVRDAIERFYQEVFPSLRSLTQPRPEAVALIEEVFRRGYRVVVATNPLFPRTAITQRLAWAGLPLENHPFALVTSFEHMHYCKPSSAYYAEILAQLGWPDAPAVMVGNDYEQDILPAARLGLATFWLTDADVPRPAPLSTPAGRGSLSDLLPWLAEIEKTPAEFSFSTPAAALAVLRSTCGALQVLAQRTSGASWQNRPALEEWSPAEILCHLRDVDCEVNIPRLEQIVHEDNPFLPAVDSDSWANERCYGQQDGLAALQEFCARRSSMLAFLEALSPRDWQRPARHAIFGPTRLDELVSFMATHDRSHIQQFSKTIA